MATNPLPERDDYGPLASHALEEATGRRPSALEITCQTFRDLVLVGLQGELDVYTSPGFREHVRRYDPAEVQLAIDLTEVGLIDSAGLGGLISLRNEVHRAGRSLGLVCPGRELARLFWVTGLRPAFAFGEDLAMLRVALADTERRPGRSR